MKKIYAIPGGYYSSPGWGCDCGDFGCSRCSDLADYIVVESARPLTSADVYVRLIKVGGGARRVPVAEFEELKKKKKVVMV